MPNYQRYQNRPVLYIYLTRTFAGYPAETHFLTDVAKQYAKYKPAVTAEVTNNDKSAGQDYTQNYSYKGYGFVRHNRGSTRKRSN